MSYHLRFQMGKLMSMMAGGRDNLNDQPVHWTSMKTTLWREY